MLSSSNSSNSNNNSNSENNTESGSNNHGNTVYSLSQAELRKRCNVIERVNPNVLRTASSSTSASENISTNNSNPSSTSTTSQPLKSPENNNTNGGGCCFDCNICFETVSDPVVTACGHLYCWPCLHAWLKRLPTDAQCPVCKASLADDSKIIPIYGRGSSSNVDPRKRNGNGGGGCEDGERPPRPDPSNWQHQSSNRSNPYYEPGADNNNNNNFNGQFYFTFGRTTGFFNPFFMNMGGASLSSPGALLSQLASAGLTFALFGFLPGLFVSATNIAAFTNSRNRNNDNNNSNNNGQPQSSSSQNANNNNNISSSSINPSQAFLIAAASIFLFFFAIS